MEVGPKKIEITTEAFFKEAHNAPKDGRGPVTEAGESEFLERKHLEPALVLRVSVGGALMDLVLVPNGSYKAYLYLE